MQKRRTDKRAFLSNLYYEMSRRVRGKSTNRPHLYKGKSLMGKDQFIEFSLADKAFNNNFDYWANNGRNVKDVPSVDRIDSSRGYDLDNIEWITHSENCRRGTRSRWKNKKEQNDN